MVDSVRVPGKGRIPTSIKKLPRRVQENGQICVSTEKGSNQGECREKVESVRVSKKLSWRIPEEVRISVNTEKWKNPGGYWEKVESGPVGVSADSCPAGAP